MERIVMVALILSGFRHCWAANPLRYSANNLLRSIQHDIDLNLRFQLMKLGGFLDVDRSGVSNSSKCFGRLGCIDITEDWYALSRPVNFLPQDRDIINTQFILWTKDTIDEPQLLNGSDLTTIAESDFDPHRETKIIIHGFIDTGFVPWVKEMAEALFDNGNFNVIAVDWGGGSKPLYNQAAANTRLVGLEIAFLIEQLVLAFGARAQDFHLIGHSLGSHISGYAGEHLIKRGIGKLGRISGLDPAEPLFQHMPEFVRLDPGDAEFVDAIHTDAKSILMFGYGMEQPVGHVDFYPNGGSDQPGCNFLDIPVNLTSMESNRAEKLADTVGRHVVACSHNRAVYLYIESLKMSKSCQMIGQECSSYEEYKKGYCFSCGAHGQHCAKLGYGAIEYKDLAVKMGRKNVKFFLNTGKNRDSFCQHHYLLELNLARPKDAERWVQGFIKVNLYGSEKEVLDLDLTNGSSYLLNLEHDRAFSSVLSGLNLNGVKYLQVGWRHHSNYFSSLCFWNCQKASLGIGSIRIKTDSQKMNHGGTKRFVLPFDSDLGSVRIANLFWEYDHDLDPLNLGKVCVFLCSDRLYLKSVTIRKLESVSNPYRETTLEVCGDTRGQVGYTEIASGTWKLFYKECNSTASTTATTLTTTTARVPSTTASLFVSEDHLLF